MCKDLIQTSLLLPDELIQHDELVYSAFDIATENKISAYDSTYLALATNQPHAGIITLDKKMREVAQKLKIELNIIEPAVKQQNYKICKLSSTHPLIH